MDSFRWLAVALSMILGLGVTKLLSGLIDVFRSRHDAKLDWVPVAWAGCIFIAQLQYWWAIVELPSLVPVWTLGHFAMLVCLALLLFVSAALVHPPTPLGKGDSHRAAFERDGRWALVALSAYFVIALLADWFLWGVPPLSRWGVFLVAQIILPLLPVFIRSRRLLEVITVLYVPLSIWAALDLSPASY